MPVFAQFNFNDVGSNALDSAPALGDQLGTYRNGAASAGGADRALASLVESLIEDRNSARAAKDFTAADRIRDELAAAGISVEDGPAGSHWSIT